MAQEGQRKMIRLCFVPNKSHIYKLKSETKLICQIILIYKATYQVQTNISVQTMKTSIQIIGSTFKGYGGLSNFTIWTRPWIE